MRVRVVADLVAVRVDPLEQARRLVRRETDHEERRLHVLLAKYVENPGREARVGTVVERERDLAGRVTALLDLIGPGIAREALVDDRPRLGIAADLAAAGLRGSSDSPHVSVTDELWARRGRDGLQRTQRLLGAR